MTNKFNKSFSGKKITTGSNFNDNAEGLIQKIQSIIRKDNINTPFVMKSSLSPKQNYPKLFNAVTVIKYEIPQRSFVTLKIFDSNGKESASLVNEIQEAGKHEVKWNSDNYHSGVYFYKLIAGEFRETKKMVVIK